MVRRTFTGRDRRPAVGGYRECASGAPMRTALLDRRYDGKCPFARLVPMAVPLLS
jgi:hypothetical protein